MLEMWLALAGRSQEMPQTVPRHQKVLTVFSVAMFSVLLVNNNRS